MCADNFVVIAELEKISFKRTTEVTERIDQARTP